MKHFALALALLSAFVCVGQKRVNPVIKKAGGVFIVPDAVEKPDSTIQYKIVIELMSKSDNPKFLNQALNNVARLINLHVLGGVSQSNLDVVVAIHGDATYTAVNSKAYEKRYRTPNLNIELFEELSEAGVKFFVCGQSLAARGIDADTLLPEIKIATSMLTTVTTHQLKGYAFLKF